MEHSSNAQKTESVSSDGSWVVNSSEFHRVRPETTKLICAYLVVLERGTARSPCTAVPQVASTDIFRQFSCTHLSEVGRRCHVWTIIAVYVYNGMKHLLEHTLNICEKTNKNSTKPELDQLWQIMI